MEKFVSFDSKAFGKKLGICVTAFKWPAKVRAILFPEIKPYPYPKPFVKKHVSTAKRAHASWKRRRKQNERSLDRNRSKNNENTKKETWWQRRTMFQNSETCRTNISIPKTRDFWFFFSFLLRSPRPIIDQSSIRIETLVAGSPSHKFNTSVRRNVPVPKVQTRYTSYTTPCHLNHYTVKQNKKEAQQAQPHHNRKKGNGTNGSILTGKNNSTLLYYYLVLLTQSKAKAKVHNNQQ